MDRNRKNYAFISYCHKDVRWAKWLRKKLEWYKLPSEIHNEFDDSKYIRPVFRDRDELTSGILNDSLLQHLKASKYLIVICSRNSAQSKWVSDEVQAFIDMGRVEFIIPFIVEDRFDESDCFPLSLRNWNAGNPSKNILGIPVWDENRKSKTRALVRVVSCLLQLDFDSLWQRHKRERRNLILAYSCSSVLVLFLMGWLGIPLSVSVELSGPKTSLPSLNRGIVTINDEEIPINSLDTVIRSGFLPGYFRLRRIPVSFKADRFYVDLTTSARMGAGIHNFVSLPLERDTSFAVFSGKVIDSSGEPLPGATVQIGLLVTTTDVNGCFNLTFPLQDQSVTKTVIVSKSGYRSFSRDDESPSSSIIYLIDSL